MIYLLSFLDFSVIIGGFIKVGFISFNFCKGLVLEYDFLYTGCFWFESHAFFFLHFLLKICFFMSYHVYSFHVHVLYINIVSALKMRVMLTMFALPLRFRVGGPRRPHGDSRDGAPGCCCIHRGRGQETGAAEAQNQTKGIYPSIF